jgi:hypothetical protein
MSYQDLAVLVEDEPLKIQDLDPCFVSVPLPGLNTHTRPVSPVPTDLPSNIFVCLLTFSDASPLLRTIVRDGYEDMQRNDHAYQQWLKSKQLQLKRQKQLLAKQKEKEKEAMEQARKIEEQRKLKGQKAWKEWKEKRDAMNKAKEEQLQAEKKKLELKRREQRALAQVEYCKWLQNSPKQPSQPQRYPHPKDFVLSDLTLEDFY